MREFKEIVFFLILISYGNSQCCTRFKSNKCVQCPEGTHLYRDNCIFDIKDCSNYVNGFDCTACNAGYELTQKGQCIKSLQQVPRSGTSVDNLNKKMEEGLSDEIYQICHDYLTFTRNELNGANVRGSRVRMKGDKKAEVIIQYETLNNIYYRANMQFQISQYSVKQVSFMQVSQLITIQAAQNTQVINLSNKTHKQKLNIIQPFLRMQNNKLSAFKSGNITKLRNGNYNLSLLYSSKSQNWDFAILATLINDKELKIYESKLRLNKNLSFNNQNKSKSQPNSLTQQKLIQNTSQSSQLGQSSQILPSTMPKPQKPLQNVQANVKNEDLTNENYLLIKDFLQVYVPQTKSIQPINIKRQTNNKIVLYVITFLRGENSYLRVFVKFDPQKYIIQLQKVQKFPTSDNSSSIITNPSAITNGSKKQNIIESVVQESQAFKDTNFIVLYDYMLKQSNKLKDIKNINLVTKTQNKDANTNTYKFITQLQGASYQIIGTINLNTFNCFGYTQTKLGKSSEQNNMKIDDNQNKINKDKPSHPNQSKIPNNNSNLVKRQSVNPQHTVNVKISQNLTIPDKTNNNSNSNSNKPNATLPPTLPPNISPSSANTTPINQSPSPNIQSSKSQAGKAPNTQQQANMPAKQVPANSSTPRVTRNYQSIVQSLVGLNRLNKDEMNSAQITQIDKMIRNGNPSQLKNASIIYVFFKQIGFTKNFNIYYQNQDDYGVYQAIVTRDILRKKTYFISFRRYGFL